MTTARIALAQILVEGGERSRNLQRADECIAEAAARGAHVVLLPEAMDIGWTHPGAAEASDTVPGGGLPPAGCRSGAAWHSCLQRPNRKGR